MRFFPNATLVAPTATLVGPTATLVALFSTFLAAGLGVERQVPALADTLRPVSTIAWPWFVLIGTTITLTVGILSSFTHGGLGATNQTVIPSERSEQAI